MRFEKWYDIDLLKPRHFVPDLGFPTFEGDGNSVRIGVNVYSDKAEETVTGTIKGYVILPNGVALVPFDGASDGNRAWIDLPDDALVMEGRIKVSIRCFDGDETTVLFQASATVCRVDSTAHYDPDDEVGDITDLIEEAERVSGVAAQAASDAQAALAQASDIVSYAEQTGKTDAEKAQARTNIGAASAGDVADLKSAIFNTANAPWEQGGVVLASGQLENNTKRCRTNKFYLKKGATFTIKPNGLWYNFAKYNANDNSYLAYKTTWTSDDAETTYSVEYDAYIIVWLRNADNTDIAPADVTTTVIYENDIINETVDELETMQAELPKASVRMEVYPSSNGLSFSGNHTSNDPLICTVNTIFYFRNTDNASGVAYLNRQGGTFSVASGNGLFFDYAAKTLEVIDTGTFVPSNKLLLLGKEGTVINGLWAVYYYQKAQYVNAQGQTVWTVGAGYIPTIQAACDLAADGDVIFVKCGTYTEQVSIWTRELHIIGEDKVNTILIDHSGNYDTPPLEMAMGSLSNMTIIEDGTTPTVEPSDGRYMMAYCLHIEHPNAAGKTFTIDNCDFINDIHVPLGCGMRANNTVHFRNCTFRCNATSESASAERGGFFVHAQNTANITNQNVIIENCIISSAGPRLAVMFGVPANANNTGSMHIRMSGCTVWNENRGIADNAVGWDTSGGADVMSMVHSYGNTIARLNTTT